VLTLYYQLGCVHSLRVRLVLAEKQLPFSRRIVRTDDRPSELIDMSGGEVPVLVDGSFAVTDSMVIVEFFGMEFSLADVWLVSAVEKAGASGWQPDAHLPRLRVWLARMQERACVRSERLA